MRGTFEERFSAKVTKGAAEDDCWDWLASRMSQKSPYGVMGYRGAGSKIMAHRASWLIHFGSIPAEMDVLHTCDNPPCANPRHLFLGDQGANNADRNAKGRNGSVKDRPWPPRPLVDDQVRAIRAESGSYREIADRLHVSSTQVGRIKRGEQYRHVDRNFP